MKTKGFTLIELLVVISIIALLSSVVLSSLNSARVKARDAQRKTSLGQIRNALILYYDQQPVEVLMYGLLQGVVVVVNGLQLIQISINLCPLYP
jgi:prepilin-type N-terminal cleavage/methylation domain-containing protein